MKRKPEVEIGKRAHKAVLSLFPDKSQSAGKVMENMQ